jgi:hypothetical protein
MAKHRIYTTSFASVYPLYIAKAEKKGRTKAEVDQVISWLTGYGQRELETQLEKQTDFETFFAKAPKINPSRALIKGVVCGVRVEDIKEPTNSEAYAAGGRALREYHQAGDHFFVWSASRYCDSSGIFLC